MNAASVIVVGAGPAGATAALLLARAGVDVTLIDRRTFPRGKPCGDCLSAGATEVLRRIGVLDRVEALPGARLRGWRIVAPDGRSFTAHFDEGTAGAGAFAIERAVLDGALLDAAVDAGARFIPDQAVTDLLYEDGRIAGVRTRRLCFRAPLTIGADGLRSVIAARLHAVSRPARLRKVSLTMHLPALLDTHDIGEMHAGDGICAAIAPVAHGGTRCNVTVVADAGRYGRDIARDAHAFFAAAVRSLPIRERVDLHGLRDAPILGSGPFDRPVRTAVFDGAALVGDAAGYYDPFTGQGVFQALACAELLAPVAARALARRDCSSAALRPYADARTRLLRSSRIVQRGIEFVLARRLLANFAIGRLAHAHEFARAVIRVTGDVAPASSLLSGPSLLSLISPPHATGSST
ncbi:MAG: FAD-dependent oxidoreductase [Gemmatimonadota bacterium]